MPNPKLLCVYCSSSREVASKYHDHAEKIGREMVARGWGLVYGGGRSGLMGAVAHAVTSAGGHVVGVIPEFMIERELAYREANELLTVRTMAERKQSMISRAGAFLALPGGIGTLEEISEVLTLRYLGRVCQPATFYNQDGFYDDLLKFFDRLSRERFRTSGIEGLYSVANTIDEIWGHLESPVGFTTAWSANPSRP